MPELKEGSKAPDFTLPASGGEDPQSRIYARLKAHLCA